MIRRKQVVSLLAGGALCSARCFTATGVASPPSGPASPTCRRRTPGPTATRPASKLSPELSQTVVAQGSTKLENPSALTSYYGYDNDVAERGRRSRRWCRRRPARPARPTRPSPTRTPTSSSSTACTAPTPTTTTAPTSCSRATRAARGASYITRINLDADAAHRVTLLATQRLDGHRSPTIDGSTWDPWAKRLLLTTENPSAPTYAATPDYPSTVDRRLRRARAAAATRASRTTRTATSGSSRTSAAPSKPGHARAKRPNSFVYRYVPAKPGDLQRQAAGAPGAERAAASRSRSTARRRSTIPTSWRCTPTATRSRPRG